MVIIMRRLNIYFIHSTKFDYNNLIYKKVLSSLVCLNHNLVLPMSLDNQNKYFKDLINSADLVVAEVSHPSFGLWLELKYLKKMNKPKLFLSLDNKIPKKYKKLVPEIKEVNESNYINLIESFIKENTKEEEKKDSTITLGEV